jgi:L-lactate dehydrogenase complex protein LldG
MNNTRATILARVAIAERTTRLPPSAAAPAAVSAATPSLQQCVDRFARELLAIAVELHVCQDEATVRARLADLIDGKRVLSWDPVLLPYSAGTVLQRPVLGASPRDAQAEAEVGVTACDGAIADTGSLALLSGPGRSRTVSLLPPIHIAIVMRSDIYPTMSDFFAARQSAVDGAASCTFVTGPSRTADIEMTLTMGIHGPGRVIVLLGP